MQSVGSVSNGKGSHDIEKTAGRKYCFAVNGTSWANIIEYFPDIVPKIIAKGTIFARMSGMQKQQLIEELKNLDYHVGMLITVFIRLIDFLFMYLLFQLCVVMELMTAVP